MNELLVGQYCSLSLNIRPSRESYIKLGLPGPSFLYNTDWIGIGNDFPTKFSIRSQSFEIISDPIPDPEKKDPILFRSHPDPILSVAAWEAIPHIHLQTLAAPLSQTYGWVPVFDYALTALHFCSVDTYYVWTNDQSHYIQHIWCSCGDSHALCVFPPTTIARALFAASWRLAPVSVLPASLVPGFQHPARLACHPISGLGCEIPINNCVQCS